MRNIQQHNLAEASNKRAHFCLHVLPQKSSLLDTKETICVCFSLLWLMTGDKAGLAFVFVCCSPLLVHYIQGTIFCCLNS